MYNNGLNRRDIINIKRYTTRELSRSEIESLTRNLYLSIEEELNTTAYYQALADVAPDPFDRELILEFSEDEKEHADKFQQAYTAITGQDFVPPGEIKCEFELDDYYKELEDRVIKETTDFKKYKEYYLMVSNSILRDIFFNAMYNKANHANRELYLIHLEMMRRFMMEDNQDAQKDVMVEVKEMMGNMLKMMGTMMEMMREMKKSTNQIKTNTIRNKER